MTHSHYTKLLLGIKDPHLTIDESLATVTSGGVSAHVLHGSLAANHTHCPHCHQARLIKWGTKTVTIKLGEFNGQLIRLELVKQRQRCKSCLKTCLPTSTLVDKHCAIANQLKRAVLLALQETRSMTAIAKNFGISPSSVIRFMRQVTDALAPKYNQLPAHLSLDEFKSVKRVPGSMSCVLLDNQTHQLVDVLENRTQAYLHEHFMRYDRAARLAVQTITMDMYGPYKNFLPRLFPNATVIIDRFHLIQRLNTGLDRIRRQTMNRLRYLQPTYYRKLKRYWKLYLKHEWSLNSTHYHYHRLFGGRITERGVVDYLLSLSPRLETAHRWLNDFKEAILDNNSDQFEHLLQEAKKYQLPKEVRRVVRTLESYRQEILNTFRYSLSNGPIEGINHKIKNLKRSGYGYRNFYNLQSRIRLVFKLTAKTSTSHRLTDRSPAAT